MDWMNRRQLQLRKSTSGQCQMPHSRTFTYQEQEIIMIKQDQVKALCIDRIF